MLRLTQIENELPISFTVKPSLSLGQRYVYNNLDETTPLVWIGEVRCLFSKPGTDICNLGNLQIIQVLKGIVPEGIFGTLLFRTYQEVTQGDICCPKYSVCFFKDIDELKEGKRLFTYLEGQDKPYG
jgi:hypothetical protein